jgi:hypothetical protein
MFSRCLSSEPTKFHPKLFHTLEGMFLSSLSSTTTPNAIDLPRLINRTTFCLADSNEVIFNPSTPTDPPETGLKHSFLLIIDLLLALSTQFEGRPSQLKQPLLDCIHATIESKSTCEEMLTLLSRESPTSVNALRMVTQSVVIVCLVELKSGPLLKYQTRDVRTRDGWQVTLTLGKDEFTCLHTRKEQSDEWVVEWAVQARFDPKVTRLMETSFKIKNVEFKSNPTGRRKRRVENEFCVGTAFVETN